MSVAKNLTHQILVACRWLYYRGSVGRSVAVGLSKTLSFCACAFLWAFHCALLLLPKIFGKKFVSLPLFTHTRLVKPRIRLCSDMRCVFLSLFFERGGILVSRNLCSFLGWYFPAAFIKALASTIRHISLAPIKIQNEFRIQKNDGKAKHKNTRKQKVFLEYVALYRFLQTPCDFELRASD